MELTKVANVRWPQDMQGDPADRVYIGRPGYFGNPYVIGQFGWNREDVLFYYSLYFTQQMTYDDEFRERIEALRGKTLLCFCKPDECHGDIIAGYLNDDGY